MRSDDFVRSVGQQILAFLAAVLVSDLIVFLTAGVSHGVGDALAFGFVSAVYMLVFLLPFFLLDLCALRPVMVGRVPVPVIILIELAVLIATQVLLRWQGISAVPSPERFFILWQVVRHSVIFMSVYAPCVYLIARLTSHATNAA